ncbi:MAG: FHA domain-containing protein [Pseudomonadota bacterium]
MTDETLEPTVEAPHISLRTYLIVERNGDVVAEYPVVDGTMTIGRTKNNHIRIKDTSISRHHAQILTVDNQSLLEDIGSRNGTYHKSKLVKRRTMKNGERFRIGDYVVFLEERRGDSEVAYLMNHWYRGIAPDTSMEVPVPVF